MAHQIDESKPKYLSQTRFMSGRRIIKTSVTEITDENVVDVLRKALATHDLNRSEIDYLWKYYRGDQPIRNRVKDVRPEICNKITENRANEIVSFKVGYLCGEPIQYVSRNGGEEIVKQINTLNEYMFAEDKIFDGNVLYESKAKAMKGSDWKPQVQRFNMTYLLELSKMQRDLEYMEYEFLPTTNFTLHERGKLRRITGEQVQDRIVKHALCDEVLNPLIEPHLIYDNGASVVGKGIAFTRKRLLTHLRKYYAQHGSNEGYILLIDFSKYYDNIRHDVLLKLFEQYVDDEHALWLLRKTVERSRVDVSYMSDEEYEHCLDKLFDSLLYQYMNPKLFTGEKFMGKHLNIGDQVAQTAGISYRIRIDNYVKIVRGVKFYAGYMDDSYAIHESKEFLQELLEDIIEIANELGITVNTRKTRICKLSEHWRFLQVQYSLTDTGRVIQKINPKRLTAMRRKMKKLAPKLTEKEFTDLR